MRKLARTVRKAAKSAIRTLPLSPLLKEKILFAIQMGYWPDFANPNSFCEKLHRRKLYERDWRLVELSDKIKVRDFVAATIGVDYLVPLRYAGTDLSPELLLELGDQLVVKKNNDCGSAEVIAENTPEIAKAACTRIAANLSYGEKTNEWWYEMIPPGYLVEERLIDPEQANGTPLDYKFFVFNRGNGESSVITEVVRRVNAQRQECSFFDEEMRPLFMGDQPVRYRGCPGFSDVFPEHDLFEEMKSVALSLSRGFDFVRVDLYAVEGKVYFGEMTFNPAEGRFRISPAGFDFELGEKWVHPTPERHSAAA